MKSMNDLNPGDPSPVDSTAKHKNRPSGEKDKAEPEKCEAEGLPKGWTKEIKVTKKGRKIRRDPYYTDPLSGYVFRSMKDALRYVETGEIGKLAIKPKEKTSNVSESKFDEASLPAAVKKQKLEVNGTTSTNISNPSSKLPEIAEKPVDRGAGTEDVANGEEGSQSKNSDVLESKSSSQKVKSKRASLGKSEEKKDLTLPRRTSKRLSGLPLDPTPELKPATRANRAAVNQSNDKASTGTSRNPTVNSAAIGKAETVEIDSEKPECATAAPSANAVVPEDSGKFQADDISNEKSGLDLALPLGELCQDPCIAFAIKTLTGISFDNPDTVQVSTGSNSDFGGSLAASEEARNGVQFPTQQSQKSNNVVTGLQVDELEVSNRDNGKLDFSFAEVWADPCIEFAIKTLTGDIPLDCSQQQKASSSQSMESSGVLQNNRSEIFSIPESRCKNANVGYSNGSMKLGTGVIEAEGVKGKESGRFLSNVHIRRA